MSDLRDALYCAITGASLLLSVMGLWFCALITGIDRWDRRFFLTYFSILLLSSVSSLAEIVLDYCSAPQPMILGVMVFETLLLSLSLPLQALYLLHCCGESPRASRLLRVVLCLWVVFFVLLASIPIVDGFVHLTHGSHYEHGPLYPLFLLPSIAILLTIFTGTLRRRARLSHKAFLSFAVAQVPMAAALVANLFVNVEAIFSLTYVFSALAMYSLVLSDQIERDRRRQREIVQQQQEIAQQQREIAHERASVMVLQMRPHFIYNTLMGIYSLCRTDPQKARQVTLDFTNYLRKNFNAVASDRAIPFSTELEHTRAYLAVEQAQYEEMLVVAYDTAFTQFRLPPLTLQPIVENAVKHGMDPDADPLQISIRTRHTGTCAEVVVEDTGPGFDPLDEGEPHIALKNIQQRLQMMCGGSMAIEPRDGGGSVVRLTIP